jgi:hypothetical protein
VTIKGLNKEVDIDFKLISSKSGVLKLWHDNKLSYANAVSYLVRLGMCVEYATRLVEKM